MRSLRFESLEDRTLLSVVPILPVDWQAQPSLKIHLLSKFNSSGSSTPYGLSPNQVRGAYGLGSYTGGALSNGISFGGVQGDGRGQTIAIVDAYDYPTAASDLNAFSTYYGLPTFGGTGNPTFTKLNQTGRTTPPGTDPLGPWSTNGRQGTWAMEAALDIQWAHAMAPMANIILFEASNTGNGLYTAVQTAAKTPGVVVISMSWGGNEFSGQTTYDNYFVTPSGHLGGSATMGGTKLTGGVTFFASSGDNGAYSSNTSTITPQYPTSSPNIVSVGGTSLYVSGINYGSETTWGNGTSSGTSGGGGGGISKYEVQPSYQSGVVNTFSTTRRTYPDISAEANPNTGVPIYDSWDFGASMPWVPGYMGGTSLACPLWAGMVSVADQGRATAGLGSLDGKSQTLPALYKMAATDFHDITTGSSIGPSPTYNPGANYDLASGLGSPVGNLLIPQLVGGPSIATPAAASPNPVSVMTTNLSVLGADSGGESTLNYTWTTTTLPSGATAPIFSTNASNAAKNTTATFSKAGIYGFTVTITDAGGLSTSSTVSVNMNQTLAGITVTPAMPTLVSHATQQFTATGNDQFGNTMSLASTIWSATPTGSISSGGLFTAPYAADSIMVTATSGAFNVSTVVTVTNSAPTVATVAAATPNSATGTTVDLSVLGADDASEANLAYTWTTMGTPPAAVSFSTNGSNAAKITTATFTQTGSYSFLVTITDAGGLSTSSIVSVTVNQTPTSILVQSPTGLAADGTEQFTATENDQFGMALTNQPQFTWSLVGDGSISATGVFTPPYAAGTATIRATSNSITGSAVVTLPGEAQLAVNSNTWNAVSSWTSTTFGSAVGSPGLRGVAGDEVVFDSVAGGMVNLDGVSPNLADVTFNSTGSYTIAQGSGGTLHFANGASPATLSVVTGSHTISSPVALNSNVIVLPTVGSQLTIPGGISGSGTLTVNDHGTVVLTGTNSYTGGTVVNAGTLILTNSSAIAENTSLTIGAGGTLIFDPSLATAPFVAQAAMIPVVASSATTIVTSIALPNDTIAPTSGVVERVASDAAKFVVNSQAGGNVRLPSLQLFGGTHLGLAHPPVAVTLGTPVADMAWLLQAATSLNSSDQHPKKDVAIRALDALFAQYGR